MRHLLRLVATCALTLAVVEPPVSASQEGVGQTVAPAPSNSSTPFDQERALRISQSAIGTTPGDYAFLDRQARTVHLSDYRGKPLLVSFIYTGCFQVCPTNTRSLGEAIQSLTKIVGENQFNVVSIGFNQPFDSPQALRSFAAQHAIKSANWEFLSPDASIVERLTRDFGFSYAASAAGIDHVLEVTILDGQGRIYSQVYGDRMAPDKLGEPVRQLLRGTPMPQTLALSDIVDRVRILCTVYDPATGTYRYDYGLILEIMGGCSFFLVMLIFFADEWRTRRRLRGQASGRTAHAQNP